MKAIKNRIIGVVAIIAIAAVAAIAAPAASNETGVGEQQVAKKVRHELVTLPYYGVFDNLAYKIDGNTVTLYGQVVQPSTRSDAEPDRRTIDGLGFVCSSCFLTAAQQQLVATRSCSGLKG